jgi:transcriptional regulator with XRE-family HTH domain
MSTLEQRVLEAIEATGLNPADLAAKIGISKQGVYDWKRGDSVSKMKGENLVELAELSGFEPLWIMKGKGSKKKSLSETQKDILTLASGMSDTAMQHWIAIGKSLISVIPTSKVEDETGLFPGALGPSLPIDPRGLKHNPDAGDKIEQRHKRTKE